METSTTSITYKIQWKANPAYLDALMRTCLLKKTHLREKKNLDEVGAEVAAELIKGPLKNYPDLKWPSIRNQYYALLNEARKHLQMRANRSGLPDIESLPEHKQIAHKMVIEEAEKSQKEAEEKASKLKRNASKLVIEGGLGYLPGTPLSAAVGEPSSASSASATDVPSKRARVVTPSSAINFDKFFEQMAKSMDLMVKLHAMDRGIDIETISEV